MCSYKLYTFWVFKTNTSSIQVFQVYSCAVEVNVRTPSPSCTPNFYTSSLFEIQLPKLRPFYQFTSIPPILVYIYARRQLSPACDVTYISSRAQNQLKGRQLLCVGQSHKAMACQNLPRSYGTCCFCDQIAVTNFNRWYI